MNGQKSAGAQPDPHGESYRSFAQDGMERENEEEEEVEGEQLRESSSGVPIQWPLFESPTMTTIRVTSYTDRQGTIYFAVQPTLAGFSWAVERTYEDFARLHKYLVEHHGISKSLLPGRRLFGYFGSPKPQALKEMQVKLDQLLKAVVQKYPLPPRVFLEFCDYPFCDVLSITQALAVYVSDEGDKVLSNNKALFMSPLQLHCIGHRMTLPIASSGTGSLKADFGNLLDFMMQLQKLKIAPSTEDSFSTSSMEDVSFDLSLLKSLIFLTIDSIELKDLKGRESLTTQLEGLDIRRCLTSLQEILVVYPADCILPLHATVDYSRALQWTPLKKICFKLNSINSIDKSLQLLPNLECLDLSYNLIETIENIGELPHLTVVDLSHNKISHVQDLHSRTGNISKLSLAHNDLSSLEGIAKCFKLVYLDLSFNQISEVTEVGHLSGLPALEDLYLLGNPVKQSSSYRCQVLSQLTTTAATICLDGKKSSQDELELTASFAGAKSHRRVPSRTADIKPDRDEDATKEAQGEFEDTSSYTNRLEEMRKTGGDKWLSLLTADRAKQTLDSSASDDVVTSKPHKGKRRKTHNQRPAKKEDQEIESSVEQEPPAPVASKNPFPVEAEEEELSKGLQEMIHSLQTEKLHLSDFPVTLLEYSGPLDSLSSQDVDQKLVNSRLEECSVCVDTSVMRLVETVMSSSKTRCQRDLALLEDIRFHEGKKKAVCLRFSRFTGRPLWVIYCVQDLGALARLYVAVQQGLKNVATTRSSSSSGITASEVHTAVEDIDSSQTTKPCDDDSQQNTQVPAPQPQLPTAGQIATEPVNQATSSYSLQQSSVVPSVNISAVPENAIKAHLPASVSPRLSRSPSPETKVPSKQPTKGYSTLPSPVKQMAMSSKTSTEGSEKLETGSKGGNVEPSPTKAQQQPVKVEGEPMRAVLPSTEKVVNLTESHETTLAPVTTHGGKMVQQSPVNSLQLGDSKPTKLSTGSRKMVKKPGLEKQSLLSFFSRKIAREQKEVVLNIMWCGASLTSTPGCEIEAGLFLSDKGLYLLQVMDTECDDSHNLSWHTENAPLICSFHAYLTSLSQVRIGIFDQSVIFQCVEKGALKSLVVYPRTDENMVGLLENLKAALDSSRIPHIVTSVQESILSESDSDSGSVLLVNPDVSDLQKLKECLVKPQVIAHCCTQLMGFSEPTSSHSFMEVIQRASEDAAAKFEIVQYLVVSEISSDLLPISNGTVHFQTNVLVLTNTALYLCKDESASWPTDPSSPVSPPFSRYTLLDSHPIEHVTGIEMCEKAQAIVSFSDPVYEFRISFTSAGNVHSSDGSCNWQLCVYDRQYISQFFTCLQPLWNDIRHNTLTITHTTEPLTPTASSSSPPAKIKRARRLSTKSDISSYDPSFFESQALVQLASLSSSERLLFFKKHVSEAQFMNSDEVPLAVFLGICSTSVQGYTQIEAAVIASQYAVYLLSDVDNIRKWLDGGGASSFSRMSLLNKQGTEAKCFFRLWINDIKEIQVGFFYLSMQLTTSNAEQNFAIHSQDASSMLALLCALSCSTTLCNTLEQKVFDELLSDYIDLGGNSLGSKAQKYNKRRVEFQETSVDNQETLKQILLCISPSITKSSSIEQSTSVLQIILGQVMMMIEEISIRGSLTIQYHLQLVLLTNFGLFVCANSAGENYTPAVLQPVDLKVKRWCHIDLIDHVEVVSNPHFQQCKGHVFSINLQSQKGAEGRTLVLAAQNREQLKHFLYYLSLLWRERSEKHLPVYTA